MPVNLVQSIRIIITLLIKLSIFINSYLLIAIKIYTEQNPKLLVRLLEHSRMNTNRDEPKYCVYTAKLDVLGHGQGQGRVSMQLRQLSMTTMIEGQ